MDSVVGFEMKMLLIIVYVVHVIVSTLRLNRTQTCSLRLECSMN